MTNIMMMDGRVARKNSKSFFVEADIHGKAHLDIFPGCFFFEKIKEGEKVEVIYEESYHGMKGGRPIVEKHIKSVLLKDSGIFIDAANRVLMEKP